MKVMFKSVLTPVVSLFLVLILSMRAAGLDIEDEAQGIVLRPADSPDYAFTIEIGAYDDADVWIMLANPLEEFEGPVKGLSFELVMPEWIRILSPQLLVDGVLTEPSENTFEARFDSCLSVVGDIPVFQFTAVSLMPDDTPWDDFICLVSPAIGDEDSPRPMTISCDADTLECETLASDWQGDAVGCLSVNRPGGPIIGYGGAGVWRCGTPVEIPTVKTSFGRIKARHR